MLWQDAQTGKTYVVESDHLPQVLARRLEALGMTRQSPVSVINRNGKGILMVKIRGARFALGENITASIAVQDAEARA